MEPASKPGSSALGETVGKSLTGTPLAAAGFLSGQAVADASGRGDGMGAAQSRSGPE